MPQINIHKRKHKIQNNIKNLITKEKKSRRAILNYQSTLIKTSNSNSVC